MLPLHWSIKNAPGPGSTTCGIPLLKCIIRVTTIKQWNALPSLILGRGDSNLNTSQTLILLIHLVPWQRSQRQAALPRSLSRIPTDSHSLGAGLGLNCDTDWTLEPSITTSIQKVSFDFQMDAGCQWIFIPLSAKISIFMTHSAINRKYHQASCFSHKELVTMLYI